MGERYRERVWKNKELKGGRLLVMLALADHTDDSGECYPGMPLLIEKTRLTDRQLRRVLNGLNDDGLISIEERAIGRGKRPHYKLFPCEKADKMSEQKEEIMSDLSAKADILSQESGNNVRNSDTKADISNNKSGHLQHEKADISDADYSHARSEPTTEPITEPTTEKEGDAADAAPPVGEAWPDFLVAFCWVCHGHQDLSALTEKQKGILTSEAKRIYSKDYTIADLRTWFRDKWQKDWRWTKDKRHERPAPADVRSMIPSVRDSGDEPEVSNYTKNGSGRYSVDIPGVVAMPASARASPPLPPPLVTDDPWAIALAEIVPALPPHAAAWLKDSRCEQSGELAGYPLYRVYARTEPGNIGWLEDRAAPLIRKTLSSILRKRIEIDIVAAEGVPVS